MEKKILQTAVLGLLIYLRTNKTLIYNSLMLICILGVLLSHFFIFFRFCFLINVCMALFLFDNVIYVFLLLWLCILIVYLIVCLGMITLTEGFPCFFPSCRTNARVKPAKTGTARTLPNFCVVLCIFVLFYVLFVLCRSLYCLCV